VARSRRSPGTSALLAGRSAVGGGRAERVEKLLVGELLDTARLPYDFEVHHIAVVAVGSGAAEAIDDLTTALHRLVVQADDGVVWGWFGKRDGFDPVELEAFGATDRSDLRLAIGEPAHGLAGWRLTHHQARAALSIAMRGDDTVVRYADVALLASIVKDDLLATSLLRLYIEPLEGERDGGEALRQTLRAYFAAGRNVSLAGAAIGVTRQAVARRLLAAEERLGRSIAACGVELEIALRYEALEPTPLSVL
jgi:DNA-binding PucR family transcriptional regulator